MSAFHNVRLPDDIEQGALGGPGFLTRIVPLEGGGEKRNTPWAQARAKWDVGYGIRTRDLMTTVIAFFNARRGMLYSFLFKDWSDYEMDRQTIGTTDGSTDEFPIYKRYTSGGENYDRTLTKIVSGAALAWVGGVSRTVVYDTSPAPTEVAISTTTGIATLGSTLAALVGSVVEVECEFNVPVRFDTDDLQLNVRHFNALSAPNIPIVEVRLD